MKKLFVIIAINFMYNGCGIYTFSGASIPNEAKTIGINYFTNKAANVQPILSQLFTEKLKDRVVEQTRLILSDEGDLQFSGFISEYTIKPIAITSTETASKALAAADSVDEAVAVTDDRVGSAHQGGVRGESGVGRRCGKRLGRG